MKAKSSTGSTKKVKKRQTIDGGVFSSPLRAPRRLVTIEQKLKVLDLYEELRKEKYKAIEELKEPRPLGKTRADLQVFFEKKKRLRKKANKNLQKLCKEKFPDIVGRSQVCKWRETCRMESWRGLPQIIQARCVATSNSWRQKLGLLKKGPSPGGKIPWAIQKELDVLMIEASSGTSDVSSRKELITVEHIVPRQVSTRYCINMEISMFFYHGLCSSSMLSFRLNALENQKYSATKSRTTIHLHTQTPNVH